MKILMVNKFYYIKGGSETYLFSLKELLEKEKHEVIPFSMKDDKNFDCKYSDYFIDSINYSEKDLLKKIKNGLKIIYNYDAANKIEKLLNVVKPDIVHLHLFQHQISPSILKVIKSKNIPILYTVHDLKPICLNYKMLNSKGICEECIKKKYYKCLMNRCVKNSYLYSFINTIEGYFHEYLKSYDLVDIFITPSQFYRKKMLDAGFKEEKVMHIPNFINIDNYLPSYDFEDYFVYLGRLSEEKGIKTLITAMSSVPQAKLKIIGTGPLQKDLKEFVQYNRIDNIEFLGFKTGDELKSLVSKCKGIIIPSEWYENGPMSVLEAMALGKAIIGSRQGGIPEMIIENENGYLFESGNSIDLANKINELNNDNEKILIFGEKSRFLVETKFSHRIHYDQIIQLYNKIYKDNK